MIAFNDRCATGVVDTLVHRGRRVPGDVSVVGYDDSRLAEAPHVQMTTVSQDATALAEAAVDQALEHGRRRGADGDRPHPAPGGRCATASPAPTPGRGESSFP